MHAAVAVWRYSEASARLIFPEDEAMEALERSLLEKITANPSINRKLLHKALGGHVQAQAMVDTLGKLAARGKVRSEAVAAGGRPSECWWPVQPSATVSIDAKKSGEANERTKPAPDSRPDARVVGVAKRHFTVQMIQPEPGRDLFDRSPDSITLADLLGDVREMGGKIVRSVDGAFQIRGVDNERVDQGILDALVTHRDELDLIVPPITSPATETTLVEDQPVGVAAEDLPEALADPNPCDETSDPKPMTDEEFHQALMRAAG